MMLSQLRHRAPGLVAMAILLLAPAVAQAQVLVDGTITLTSLFGPNPPIPLTSFVVNGSANALTIPDQPQAYTNASTDIVNSGVVISFMNAQDIDRIGPGALAVGHLPGGLAKPVTFAPSTQQTPTAPPVGVSAGNFHVGFKPASPARADFGGTLRLVGAILNVGKFQFSPATFIFTSALRPINAGRAPTDVATFPTTRRTVTAPGSNPIATINAKETRNGFPWTTGPISGVALVGPGVPYGGAGVFGTPSAPPLFQTVEGFHSLAGSGTSLTGNLQLVSPGIQSYSKSTGPGSVAIFWTLDLTVVPEPAAVAALASGLALVLGLGVIRRRA